MKSISLHWCEKLTPGLALAALLATTPLQAQTAAPAPDSSSSQDTAPQKLSDADLTDLLGPIALYPDALVAVILPASTVASDITMADRYLDQNGGDANVDDQPWDPSVRALYKYPDVLKWMDQNLEWTNSLGEAFVDQPADVMNAIQELRAQAKDKGNLINTPQQTVVVEKKEIRIVPTDPQVIYVPQYDPEVVYAQPYQPDYGPAIAFGTGLAVGAWLSYDFDWGNDGFYYGNNCGWNNHDRWNDRGYQNGNVNVVNTNINNTNINNFTNNTNVHRWQASPNARRQFDQRRRENLGNARIARAHAEVRHPNGKVTHPAATNARVPKPGRLNETHPNNGGKHPNAQVHNPNAPGNPNKGPHNGPNKGPGNAPGVNGGNKHPNAENRPGNGGKSHPTAAPNVPGQSGKPGSANRPNGNDHGKSNGEGKHPNKPNNSPGAGEGGGKPKHQPTSAPSGQGGGNGGAPKKHPTSSPESSGASRPHPNNEAKHPSAQPQNHAPAHHSEPKPNHQSSQPKPQPHAQPHPQSHPQAQKPHPQGNGGNKGDGDKKKKKDN